MKASSYFSLALCAFSSLANAAMFGDQVCRGSLCISAVYDDQALSVKYVAAYTGTVGWVGVGQGSRMSGANMMVSGSYQRCG